MSVKQPAGGSTLSALPDASLGGSYARRCALLGVTAEEVAGQHHAVHSTRRAAAAAYVCRVWGASVASA